MSQQKELGFNDADNYAEMMKPHADAEAADTTLKAFFQELYELRNKHRLANVSVIVSDSVSGSGCFYWSGHCGDENQREAMAAWNLGNSSSARQDAIRQAMATGAATNANRQQD